LLGFAGGGVFEGGDDESATGEEGFEEIWEILGGEEVHVKDEEMGGFDKPNAEVSHAVYGIRGGFGLVMEDRELGAGGGMVCNLGLVVTEEDEDNRIFP